jgi:hypothetical protein
MAAQWSLGARPMSCIGGWPTALADHRQDEPHQAALTEGPNNQYVAAWQLSTVRAGGALPRDAEPLALPAHQLSTTTRWQKEMRTDGPEHRRGDLSFAAWRSASDQASDPAGVGGRLRRSGPLRGAGERPQDIPFAPPCGTDEGCCQCIATAPGCPGRGAVAPRRRPGGQGPRAQAPPIDNPRLPCSVADVSRLWLPDFLW